MTDLRLLFVNIQKQLAFDIRLDVFKGSLCGSLASTNYHHVGRVSREAVLAAFEFVEQDVC